MHHAEGGDAAFPAEAPHKAQYLDLVLYVEACHRFVKQHHLGVLANRAGDDRPLPFAAGKRQYGTFGKLSHARARKCCIRSSVIRFRFPCKALQVRVAPHEHDVTHGEIKLHYGVLRYERHALRKRTGGKRRNRVAADAHAPGFGRKVAADAAQERRLSAAVVAEDGNELSRRDGKGNIGQNGLFPIGE